MEETFKPLRILVACEESQKVCKAFRILGHEAYSCDILPCSGGEPQWHIQDDVLNHLDEGWDMLIGFPDCTYLTVTGNKWLKDQPKRASGALVGEERRAARVNAIEFFMKLVNCGIPKIAIENPIGIMSTVYRKPDQIIQPWQHGHQASKSTCIWLKNLPLLVPTNIVDSGEWIEYKSGKRVSKWYADAAKYSSIERTRIRNTTFQNIATQMALQWSKS